MQLHSRIYKVFRRTTDQPGIDGSRSHWTYNGPDNRPEIRLDASICIFVCRKLYRRRLTTLPRKRFFHMNFSSDIVSIHHTADCPSRTQHPVAQRIIIITRTCIYFYNRCRSIWAQKKSRADVELVCCCNLHLNRVFIVCAARWRRRRRRRRLVMKFIQQQRRYTTKIKKQQNETITTNRKGKLSRKGKEEMNIEMKTKRTDDRTCMDCTKRRNKTKKK